MQIEQGNKFQTEADQFSGDTKAIMLITHTEPVNGTITASMKNTEKSNTLLIPDNILVTGGAGYIGSIVVEQLANAGKKVVVIDNLSNGHREAIIHPNVEMIMADISDKELLKKIMIEKGTEAVMHFAAFIEAGESMKKPEKYFRNNTAGSLSLLEAMKETDVSTIVFSSTAAVYGNPQLTPITEDMPLMPINVYGESKLMVERLLSWFNEIYGLKYAALRYFNACGATEKLGERHQPETHLIPLAIEAVLGQRPKLFLYGTDYPTHDGTCIRDYIHVSDLASAHLLALEKLNQSNGRLIYNLGNQTGFSNREVIDAVSNIVGKKVPIEETERRPGDPPILIASSEKIKKELGWKPAYTSLEDIIQSAYLWRINHPHGYTSE